MYSQNKQNPTVRAVKSAAAAPLFLVGAIGYSVYGLLQFLDGFIGGANMRSQLNELLQDSLYNNSSFMQGYINGYTGGYMIAMLIQLIPVILIATGMWITFASAKNERDTRMSVAGLSMIRIITIIELIFLCIATAVLEVLCMYAISATDRVRDTYFGSTTLESALIIVMVIVAAAAVVQIIYYIKLCSAIRTMKETVITGIPDAQISLYVEVYCYIAGGMAAISALLSLSGMSVYGFLANAGLATADICFGIFLRKYRGNMEMFLHTSSVQTPHSGSGQLFYQQSYQEPMQQAYQEAVQQSYQQAYQEPVQQSYQPPYQEPVQQSYQPPYQEPAQQSYQPPYREPMQQAYQEPVQQPYQNPAQPPFYDSESETTVLPYYNETSVLSGQFMADGRMRLMRMTRQKTGETFCISKPSFWIGKDAANVDYCITDNTAVSRRHALVTIQNGKCYIRDNHSTNRLFINGQAIQQDVDTPLADGDRVRMGDEEFIVSIS